MPGQHSPFAEHSILGKLSFAVLGLSGITLLLFTFYKIASSRYFRLPLLAQNDVAEAEETLWQSTDALDSLPVVQFRDDCGGSSDCAICLEEFQGGERIGTLPYCSHSFHVHCVATWLRSRSDCPLCRKKVLGDAIDPNNSPVSISTGSSLDPLPREDVSGERSGDYRLFVSQDARYQAFGGDARGIQSLVWL